MLLENAFPILEFDDNPVARLNPEIFGSERLSTNKLVICFFPEVLEKLRRRRKLEVERVIGGENPVTLYRFRERPEVLLTLGQIGCPACGGNLDLFQAMGVRKVLFCGGGGVLDREIAVGQLLLVDGAIRDEGFSYHYLPPARVVYADPGVTEQLAGLLDRRGVPYLRGLTWTTDALFRETADKIAARKREGAKIVEMEQAGCLAVAQCRGLAYGALIYGGDDLSGPDWDGRGWRSREGLRYDLVALCRDLVCEL